MCGIFGTTRWMSSADIEQVAKLLHHRGPDSGGRELLAFGGDQQLLLLHTRLAIQDLSPAGHQPMCSKDGRWWLTFNGEIYNHFDLRANLNVEFVGTSDTETLVEHIAAQGVRDTVAKLRGIFGFAAYDTQAGKLYLVRDNFGIKPVYYHLSGRSFAFSSELKPLIMGQALQLNEDALEVFLQLRYCPSPHTLVEGINRLAPGHLLELDLTNFQSKVECYVKPTLSHFNGTVADAVDQYQSLLGDVVEKQLLSDVPVGVLLSGGIDSAVIAALAREKSEDLTSFTVGFGDQHYECEIDDAAETSQILGIPHHYVTVTPETLLDSLETIVSAVEEPLGTTSIMPMWYLIEKAKQHVTVVLTGQGNDEPWGGYNRYRIELLMKALPFLKASPFRGVSRVSELFKQESIRRGLRCLGLSDTAQRFTQAYAFFSDQERQLIRPGASTARVEAIDYWLDWLGAGNVAEVEQQMRIDTRMNLADDLLLYGDKISMAFAVEARVPMLDPHLVEFIESLPIEYRTRLRKTKVVHRLMAEQYLPARVINRRKKAFQVPFGNWSRGIWRDYVSAKLLDKNLKLYNYLDYQGVNTLWQRHLRGKPDYSKQIFALLTLSIWSEQYL